MSTQLSWEKKDSLKDLVEYKKAIFAQAEEAGTEVPYEVLEMIEINELILANKVDTIGTKLAAIDAHIEATEAQLVYLKDTKKKAEAYIKQVVESSPDKRVDGTVYAFRVQNNGGQAALKVLDEAAIQSTFKDLSVEHSFDFHPNTLLLWAGAILRKKVTSFDYLTDQELKVLSQNLKVKVDIHETYSKELQDYYHAILLGGNVPAEPNEFQKQIMSKVFVSPSNKRIREALKANPEAVTGVSLERGTQLRIEAGKAKSKAKTDKKLLTE